MAGRITKDNDGGFILNLDGHRQLYKASYEGNLYVEEVLAKVYAWCCNTSATSATTARWPRSRRRMRVCNDRRS